MCAGGNQSALKTTNLANTPFSTGRGEMEDGGRDKKEILQ
jgi:hypothetical protein